VTTIAPWLTVSNATDALTAGATEINPMDDAYGWRIGKIVDPFGHVWEIGRRLDG
jgi:PhnB protein